MIRRYRTTRRSKERIQELAPLKFEEGISLDSRVIYLDPKRKGQSFLGFGGALTRATIENLLLLDKKKRKEVLDAYFSTSGLNYSLLRLTISSSDFGSDCYDYLEKEGDLSSFSLKEEEEFLFPILEELLPYRNDWQFLASSWCPPAYMKENGDRCYGGHLRRECYADYGEYLALTLATLKERGIKVDYLTVQNEPEAVQLWESMEVSAQEESLIIKEGIVPALKRHNLKETKIIIWDHNKDEIVRRANVTLEDKEVDEMVYGIGYHWYVSDNFENLDLTHALHPDKHLFFTEGCVELANIAYGDKKEEKNDLWEHGWRYAHNIIQGFKRHTEAFFDWNLLLNEKGGPTWVSNYCEAPIMYDRTKDELIYNPSYYYIGQFSRFLKRGARVLYSSCDFEKDVETLAFENPNGELLLFVLNRGWNQQAVLLLGEKRARISLPSDSLTTFIIDQ